MENETARRMGEYREGKSSAPWRRERARTGRSFYDAVMLLPERAVAKGNGEKGREGIQKLRIGQVVGVTEKACKSLNHEG